MYFSFNPLKCLRHLKTSKLIASHMIGILVLNGFSKAFMVFVKYAKENLMNILALNKLSWLFWL